MSTTSTNPFNRNTIRNSLTFAFQEYVDGSESYINLADDISSQQHAFPAMFGNAQRILIPNGHTDSVDIINAKYEEYGLVRDITNVDQSMFIEVHGSRIRWDHLEAGDIVEVSATTDSNINVKYYLTVLDNSYQSVRTFPRLTSRMQQRMRIERVFKLDLNRIPDGVKDLLLENSDVIEYNHVANPDFDSTVLAGSAYNIPGLLKIGDINFLVSPTQISFMTQNGYQYFPTIRTQGNPKIPTMQEVKQVNISLIFPNADSINNQLLPLFAMFKRAPFVNIYNKDICNFFYEIKDKDEDYLSVALESITIQSVQGFPNTMQANITLLPFQREALGTSFKALQNFDGVQYEAFRNLVGRDIIDLDLAASENRLYNRESNYERNIIDHPVATTSDFAKSEPFRAYYQAILKYRDVVKDEQGNTVQKLTANNRRTSIDLSAFRPVRESSYINKYESSHNNQEFSFQYKYIPENISDFNKKIADARRAAGEEISQSYRSFYDIYNAGDNGAMEDRLTTTFLNRDKLYTSIKAQFSTFDDFIVRYSNQYGIELNTPAMRDITGVVNLLFEMAPFSTFDTGSITSETIQSTLDGFGDGTYNATIAKQNVIRVLDGLSFWDDDQLRVQSSSQIISSLTQKLNDGIRALSNTPQGGGKSQQQLVTELFDNIYNFITSDQDVINLSTFGFGSQYFLSDAASTPEVITIDNKNDVVVGFGITFRNKFIPMYLSSFKYPFYQHIGGDDVNVSLQIFSQQAGREIGLKEQLSQLNDRLQNTTKLILMHSPDLIHLFDMSLNVEGTRSGNIFDVFGIKKAVFDNSNVSSIQGKPNSWNITINLTQNNFTLFEYQSINKYENRFTFEDEIINLLLRAHWNNDTQEIEMRNIRINSDYFINNLETLTRESSSLAILNQFFQDSSITESTIDQVVDLFNNPNFRNSLDREPIGKLQPNWDPVVKQKINLLLLAANSAEVFRDLIETETQKPNGPLYGVTINTQIQGIELVVDESAEAANFIAKLNENPRVKDIFRNLFERLQDLYVVQAGVMATPFKNIDNSATFQGAYDTLAQVVQFAGFLSGGMTLLTVLGATTLPVTAIVGSIGLLIASPFIAAGIDELGNAIQNTYVQIVRDNIENIRAFLSKIQYNYVNTLSRFIMKDPYFLVSLLGDSYKDSLRDIMEQTGVNCYKDFDVNLVNADLFVAYDLSNTEYSRLDFKFTPDFYLYNEQLNPRRRQEYIKDQIDQRMSAGKINAFTIGRTWQQVIAQFDAIKDVVFGETPNENAVYNGLIEDLTMIQRNQNSGDQNSSTTDTRTWDIEAAMRDVRAVYAQLSVNYSGTSVNNGTDAVNIDGVKFNILNVVRAQRILELLELQTSMNEVIRRKRQEAGLEGESEDAETELDVSDIIGSYRRSTRFSDEQTEAMIEYKGYIDRYFADHYQPVSAISPGDLGASGGRAWYGPATENGDSERPDIDSGTIQRFQVEIANKLDQVAILDSAIMDAKRNNEIVVDSALLDRIPQLSFLKWYNYRFVEQTIQDTYLLQDLYNSYNHDVGSSNRKLFPTQKIFFVEEDRKNGIRQLDDYYTYDAINSIDIVANKASAGKTAVIKLANVFNTLTNKMSLMTELLSSEDRSVYNTDDVFLGTLDIKPGTKMIIKMGYAADDKDLPVVFVGRITDLRPGPISEIVAQSYGAQLNHYIEYLNFGFASSRNERGDVAIAILDQIPGIDGLGTKDPLGFTSLTFSGTGLYNTNQKIFQKFLLSNLTSNVNLGVLSADNPRNDNIFLPVHILSSTFRTATFDWIVYQQSAWDALNEIALHSRNTYPMVKLYNNDRYSNMDELRETLIVGNKAGYYKHTDAFALSSLNYDDVSRILDEWNGWGAAYFKDILKDVIDILEVDYQMTSEVREYIGESTTYSRKELTNNNNTLKIYYQPEVERFLELFRNKFLSIVILYKALQLQKPADSPVLEFVREFIKLDHDWLDTTQEFALKELATLYNQDLQRGEPYFHYDKPWNYFLYNLERVDDIPYDRIAYYKNTMLIDMILGFLRLLKIDPEKPVGTTVQNYNGFNLAVFDEFITVSEVIHITPPITDNTTGSLATALNYKKIQQHHLLSDTLDILSNNIIVSEHFANATRVYFLDEPKSYNKVSQIPADEQKKLRQFTVKAFGATEDKDIRILESFQRNIDTNYFEIARDSKDFLPDYAGVMANNNGTAREESGSQLKNLGAHWERLPGFVTVPISILQREAAKMYQGTLQIVGNPYINPYDIVHLDDATTFMTGAFEVEEVVQTFNPQQGFITTITPNALVYDRQPIALSDVATINRALIEGKKWRDSSLLTDSIQAVFGAGVAGGAALSLFKLFTVTGFAAAGVFSGTAALAIGGMGLILGVGMFGKAGFDALIGRHVRYTNFMYETMGNIFGRDCINFTTLFYHDKPLVGGYGGVDYTNLTTLINHSYNNGPLLQRFASADDIEGMWLLGNGNFDNVGLLSSYVLTNKSVPPFIKGLFAAKVFGDLNSNTIDSFGSDWLENFANTGYGTPNF